MKKISRRNFLEISAACGFAAVIGACSNSTASSTSTASSVSADAATTDENVVIRISWWGTDARHEATLEALELYTAKHPNVTFSPEYTGFSGYHDKLITQLASNTQPDISQVDNNTYFADFASNDKLTDLTPYIGTILMLDDYSADALKWGKYNDVVYGIPTGLNGPMMMYSKEPYDNAGLEYPNSTWTWDDFVDAALTLHAADPDFYGMNEPGLFAIMSLVRQKGVWFSEEDLVLNDFSEALGEAYATFMEWRENGVVPPIDLSTGQNSQSDNLFLSGQTSAFIKHIAEFVQNSATLGKEMGACLVPGTAQDGGSYVLASMPWTIGTSSKHPEIAADVINFLINDLDAGKILTTQRGVPGSAAVREAITDVLTDAEKQVVAGVNELIDATKRIDYEWSIPGSSIIQTTIEDYSVTSAYGERSPEELAKEAYEIIVAEMG